MGPSPHSPQRLCREGGITVHERSGSVVAGTDPERNMDRIIENTRAAMEQAREAIFDLAEELRAELHEVEESLELVRVEVRQQIELVETLNREERESRRLLLVLSRRAHEVGYQRVREAYQQANDIQWRLQAAHEREQQLRRLRDNLERRWRALKRSLERAESLVSQVGLALGFLKGNLVCFKPFGKEPLDRRTLAFALIRAQEEERQRLARDIHDGPAQLLANVSLRLQTAQEALIRDQERAREELAGLNDIVRQSLHEVRRIIFNLRTVDVRELGLAGGLKVLVTEMQQRTGLRCELEMDVPEHFEYPPYLTITAIRVVQEALNNVVRHAGVDTATVKVWADEDNIHLAIKDEGRGMDPEILTKGPTGPHFGLAVMRERVELLEGTMKITSAVGEGTLVEVTLLVGGGQTLSDADHTAVDSG